MLVDTAFAEVIGKLVQKVLLGKVKTLNDFILLHQQSTIIDGYTNAFYYQFKFENWLRQLFFPEEHLLKNKDFKIQFLASTNCVYVMKNQIGELEYFSIYDGEKFFKILIEKIQLGIDFKQSKIEKEILTLVLKLEFK
jgi:hypothetical protein